MRTIVLGVGNLILGDDGVGIHVVKEIKKQINNPNITIEEAITGGQSEKLWTTWFIVDY